jgi:hypothetical protein
MSDLRIMMFRFVTPVGAGTCQDRGDLKFGLPSLDPVPATRSDTSFPRVRRHRQHPRRTTCARMPRAARRSSSTIPAGRWAEPTDIAGAVLFLCSHAADYVHGIILPVERRLDGAMSSEPARDKAPDSPCQMDS